MFNELRPQFHTRRGIILSESDPKNRKKEKKYMHAAKYRVDIINLTITKWWCSQMDQIAIGVPANEPRHIGLPSTQPEGFLSTQYVCVLFFSFFFIYFIWYSVWCIFCECDGPLPFFSIHWMSSFALILDSIRFPFSNCLLSMSMLLLRINEWGRGPWSRSKSLAHWAPSKQAPFSFT